MDWSTFLGSVGVFCASAGETRTQVRTIRLASWVRIFISVSTETLDYSYQG